MPSFKFVFAAAALLVAANANTVKIMATKDKLSKGVSPGHTTFGGELVDKGSFHDDSKSDDKDAQGGKKSGDKSGQDGKKSGNKSAQDIINSRKYCKKNSAGIVQVSTMALTGIFGAALYML
ncbi:hypothetical protein MY4038_003884 [Beauveria bassiana]